MRDLRLFCGAGLLAAIPGLCIATRKPGIAGWLLPIWAALMLLGLVVSFFVGRKAGKIQ